MVEALDETRGIGGYFFGLRAEFEQGGEAAYVVCGVDEGKFLGLGGDADELGVCRAEFEDAYLGTGDGRGVSVRFNFRKG